MSRYKVLFLPHNKEIAVVDGENLIRAAMEAGVHINASCGGEGICGKCRVIIEKGIVEGKITENLSEEDLKKGYRQACLTRVKSDIVVRIPTKSTIDSSALNMQSTPRRAVGIRKIDLAKLKKNGIFASPVEKIYLKLPRPDTQGNMPDLTRIVRYLQLHHDKHHLEADISVIRKIPDVVRKDDFKVTVTLILPVRTKGMIRIVNIQPGDTTDLHYAIAMDIGTTTIYGQIVDLENGRVLSGYAGFNEQISYGEDIITRIVYAEKAPGLERLHEVVIKSINEIINRIIKDAGIDSDEISVITLAGNTTMTQLLLKINPRHIRLSPYVPTSMLYPPIKAADFNIALGDHVTALIYPNISSYVGGDIVAGVIASGMYRSEKLSLYIDIGTNAEIAIGSKDWLACAACSAGPAFEGGGIKFGMRAVKGAIEDFSINPVTLDPMNITIGNVRPKGICGSGLIIIVAEMFEAGIIDNIGKFNRSLDTNRIREVDGICEYVLAWANVAGSGRDIVLTESDIDNLIRAKGAIYSGCITLLKEVGLGICDIDRIFIAGGFGSYIDLEKAMTIGLLPETDPDKIIFIGNGSLRGAKIGLLTNRIRKDVVKVIEKTTNFELSETPSYMDSYMAALFLPHTDMSQFPKLKARLKARKERGRISFLK